MRDETILRLAEETCKTLQDVNEWAAVGVPLITSYNAVLAAARENHPEDAFLRALQSIPIREGESVSMPEMKVLFVQLRIALESAVEDRNRGSSTQPAGASAWAGAPRQDMASES